MNSRFVKTIINDCYSAYNQFVFRRFLDKLYIQTLSYFLCYSMDKITRFIVKVI